LNVKASGLAAYFVGLIGSELGISGVKPEECFKFAIALDPRLAEPHYELGTRLQAVGQDMASIPHINEFMRKRDEAMNATPLGRAGVRFITGTNSYAFGHMTDLPRVIVMARELGLIPKYKIIWLAPEGWIANYALLDCWRAHLEVVTDHSEIAKYGVTARELELDTSFFTLPNGCSVHTRIAVPYMTREWRNRGFPPIVKLSTEVRAKGERVLRELGLPDGGWFVALHVRAAGFKGDSKVGGFNGHRLADERTYAAAVRLIGERGGYVVRLGEEQVPDELRLPHVIDYATSSVKSDWMDLYIIAKAKFLLGSSSGLTPGAGLFGTPTIATNFCTTPYRNEPESIVIPKLIYNEHEKRLATFKEWFAPPLLEMENGALLTTMGYRFIDNTPEEISSAVIEMFDRLEGRASYSQEEERMQDQFKSYEPAEYGKAYLARISREYLKSYSNLLG
jgi:putative glycosyltransferase (TIGR04372 family)